MKKVLFIAYYWPPCGGISVVRNLKFTKYLREYGWEPVIFAPENAHYPVIDETTIKDLPPNAEIIRQKVTEPFSYFNMLQGKKPEERVQDVFLVRDKTPGLGHKLGVWIRANFFIPDARMLWIRPSIRRLSKYLKTNKVDALISYGPPHTTHRIAYRLHKKFDIPWLADFQDPWSQIDYFEKFPLLPFARKKHLRQEQEVLKSADSVVIVSKSWKRDFENLSDRTVNYIPFGYDPDDFDKQEPVRLGKFIISHFGTLGIDRNPTLFWNALSELVKEVPEFDEDLQIALAGVVDFTVFDDIAANSLKKNLKYYPFLEKSKVVQWMLGSDLQLLLLNKGFGNYNVNGRIPAKLFDYLGSGRPILVIGPQTSDVARIVRETNSGMTVSGDSVPELKEAIVKYYKAWKDHKPIFDPIDTSKYSFQNLTGELAGLLNGILKID